MNLPQVRPPRATERIVVAVPVAIAYGIVLYLVIWHYDYVDVMPFFAGLVALPMAVASLVSALADPRGEKPIGRHVVLAWIVIAVLVVLSMILFREAGLCVAMAAPFFMGFSALGSASTILCIRRWRSRRLPTLAIALPLVLLPADLHLSYAPHEGSVTSVIDIAAPPEVVWRQTVEIPDVRPQELTWTFSHGILGVPQPADARLDGEGVGAVRQLRWTRGVHFQEIVTDWRENRLLAWNFRFAPDSVPAAVEAHIKVDSSYLRIASGFYRLEPLPDGRTRLTLTTRYRIATPFDLYCDFWGRLFLGDFHGVVLKLIRARSERIAGEGRSPA